MYDQNYTMQNHQQDLVDFLDTESVQFVNPYEINPIYDANLVTNPVTNNSSQQILGQETLQPGSSSGIQEDAKPLIKMEEFSDLSDLLHITPAESTPKVCTDELITPDIEKGIFDYSSYIQTKINTSKRYDNIKSKKNPIYQSEKLINFNDIDSVKNVLGMREEVNNTNSISSESKPVMEYTFNFDEFIESTAQAEIINIVDDIENFNANMYTPENTPSYVSSPQSGIHTMNSYVNSPEDQTSVVEEITEIVTPEDSNGSTEQKAKLKLKIGAMLPKVKVETISNMYDISTPDVINQVVGLGDDFNILDLVNNDDLRVLSADDDFISTFITPTSSAPSTPSPVYRTSFAVKEKRSRKRKASYYEDEEYLPPRKKPSTVSLRDIDIEGDSESDFEYESTSKVARKSSVQPRGRHAKCAYSNLPDDSEVSKYRELRDKNNEASRKSRLKRKSKEQELEKEADELHVKNIKLKAQVEQLEKMVFTFRNNLFNIMTKK